MLVTFLSMIAILCLAGVIAVYVAYPHRGQEVPHAPWLGDALLKGVEALPTLDDPEPAVRERVGAEARGR